MIGALLTLATPAFALRAEAIPSAERLRVRLSVRNVTRRPQTLWIATPGCTNSRWTVRPPGVRIVDYLEEHDKTCTLACGHKRTLRPGETFVHIVEPRIAPFRRTIHQGHTIQTGLWPGPATLTFTLAQPSPTASSTSNPVRVDVKQAWLRG